nr:hypothetical protein OG296_43455 [Streptomyces sp. NBC_01001]
MADSHRCGPSGFCICWAAPATRAERSAFGENGSASRGLCARTGWCTRRGRAHPGPGEPAGPLERNDQNDEEGGLPKA